MKKRILFVDDEAMVLQGLQRLLHSMRREWDLEFAGSGPEALAKLAASGFDVVVSDMMMPGMDGAQLLKEIQEKSPQTIRLILSGHAEQHHAIRCVGIAHQYLSKPCDPETLRATLTRLTSLPYTVQNEAMRRLLPRLERLPSLPAIYAEIVKALEHADVSMAEVGALIAQDIGATAQILKVVNSSFFGMPRVVSDPSEAVAHLGLDTVKALVLASNVFAQFEGKADTGFSIRELSAHSQQVGALACRIARCEESSRAVANDALVAGFLHDTGKLVLAANFPEQFQKCRELGREPRMTELQAEHELFGATHAQIAGCLLGLWGLPPPVVEAISLHHTPGDSPARVFSPLTAVHAADALVWERAGAAASRPHAVLDEPYVAALGLTRRLPVWRDALGSTLASSAVAAV